MSDRSKSAAEPEWSHSPENQARPAHQVGRERFKSLPADSLRLCGICEAKEPIATNNHCTVCGTLQRHLTRLRTRTGSRRLAKRIVKQIVRRLHIALEAAWNRRDVYVVGFIRSDRQFDFSRAADVREYFAPDNVFIVPDREVRRYRGTDTVPPTLIDGEDYREWRRKHRRRLRRREKSREGDAGSSVQCNITRQRLEQHRAEQ